MSELGDINYLLEPNTLVISDANNPKRIDEPDHYGDGIVIIFNDSASDSVGFRYGSPGQAFANYTPIVAGSQAVLPVSHASIYLLSSAGAGLVTVIHIPSSRVIGYSEMGRN